MTETPIMQPHPRPDTHRRLQEAEAAIAKRTAELRRLEGQRDTIVRELVDLDVAHQQRPDEVP